MTNPDAVGRWNADMSTESPFPFTEKKGPGPVPPVHRPLRSNIVGEATFVQDDPSAVRAAADLLRTLVDKGLRFVDPIRHRRHEQGAHAGRQGRRVSRELLGRGRGSPPIQGLRAIRRLLG